MESNKFKVSNDVKFLDMDTTKIWFSFRGITMSINIKGKRWEELLYMSIEQIQDRIRCLIGLDRTIKVVGFDDKSR